METIIPTISIIGSVALACISYYLTKRREHEKEIIKEKLNYYKIFSDNLATNLVKKPTAEERESYAKSVNNLYLIASYDVIVSLNKFISETDPEKRMEKLADLFFEIRRDIKVHPRDNKNTFFVKMVSP